jgi:hypothetical protein
MKQKKQIAIVRAPNAGGYVIVDNSGIPRTVGKWEEAVQILRAISQVDNSEIEMMKADIDAGKTQHFAPAILAN